MQPFNSRIRTAGRVSNYAPAGPPARVAALDDSYKVIGETAVDPNGTWSLELAQSPVWVLVNLRGLRLAAVATTAARYADIKLPDLELVRLDFDGVIDGANITWDPLELVGLPQDLIPALRAHADGTLDLHLGERPSTHPGFELQLQRGVYIISGGRFEITPLMTNHSGSLSLVSGMDLSTGEELPVADDQLIVRVTTSKQYRLTFRPTGEHR